MIYQLSGELVHVLEDSVVLDVKGVGYQVFLALADITSLPEIDKPVRFYTYHHIREDLQSLYGFSTLSARDFFILLTSVSGIGPKLGQKIMSYTDVAMLVSAIRREDIVTLTRVPGLGKKMAERMILDLKDKLVAFQHLSSDANLAQAFQKPSIETDLALALKSLGYSSEEIRNALAKCQDKLTEELSLEDGIKVLLKYL